jgi:hypothetical protein
MKKIDILKKIEEQVARGILNPNSGEPVGLKITKQNLKKSKEENEDYYKELEKKFRDYLKLDTKDNPSPKVNMTDKDHEMYYGTGMEGLKYDDEDTEKYKKFVERNKKLNEPSKDYYLKKDQVEDSFGKITKDGEHYKKHKYGKPDEYQKTPKVRITNENHNKNTMKRLTYKKPFLSHDKTMNLIPEGYKQDGNKFQMTDGVETYTIKWEGTNTTGTPTVLSYKNEKLDKEDISKMEYLYDYNSSDLLMKTNDALTENTIFNEMLNKSRSLIKEQQTSGTTQTQTATTGTKPQTNQTAGVNDDDKKTGPKFTDNSFDKTVYKNTDINNINKLNAFKNYGNVTRNDFPSLTNKLMKKLESSQSKEEISSLFRSFDSEKLPKFLTSVLNYVAKTKTPNNTDAIRMMLDGPLNKMFVWFNTFKTKDKEYLAVDADNVGPFKTELLSFITKQMEKAKKVA